MKEISGLRSEYKKTPKVDYGDFYFKKAYGMIDTVYKNVSDIRSKTPRDYETMVKLEAEFNEVMDKADTKSADINKPQTLKEFLASKMNPKPIDDSSADEDPITGLKRSKRQSKI